MFDTDTSTTSRIARLLTPRRVLPIALLFLLADLALTEALLGLAVEHNPIAAWLFESAGVTATGVVAVGVVTLAYVGLDALDRYDREARVVSAGLLAVMVVPVVWNLGIWMRLGAPRVVVSGVVETIAPAVVAAGVAVVVTTVDVGEVPSADREAVVSIVFSVLMVTSMVGGVAFVGTQPFTEKQDSTVSAESIETPTEIIRYSHVDPIREVTLDGQGSAYSGSSDELLKHNTYTKEWSITPSYDAGSDEHTYNAKNNILIGLHSDTNNLRHIRQYDASNGDLISEQGIGLAKGIATHENNVMTIGSDVLRFGQLDGVSSIGDNHAPSRYTATYHEYDPGYFYAGGEPGVEKYDITDLENGIKSPISVHGINSGNVREIKSQGEYIASISLDDLVIYSSETESGKTLHTDSNTNIRSVAIDSKTAYISKDSGVILGFDLETGEKVYEHNLHNSDDIIHDIDVNSKKIVSVSEGGEVIHATSRGSTFSTTSVQAVDQNGDPINNATVEAYRADEEAIQNQLGDSIDSAEAEADRLMDEAANPVPDAFQKLDLSPGNMDAIFPGGEPTGTYPTTHTEADMGLTGYIDSPDLQPRLTYESGESIYLYAWDASEGANMGFTDDGVTSQHVGSVDDDSTFKLTKLDAFGDEIESREINATQTYAGGAWPTTFEHDYAQTTLPDGYYRVSVKGSDTPGYVIKVGDAANILETGLEDEAGQLTDRAENLQNRLNDGLFTRQKGVTNESGTPQDFTLPQGEVAIQAYKGPDATFFDAEDPTQINASDLREAAEAGYDGAVYLPSGAQRVNTNDLDANDSVTIELRKVDIGRFSGMEEFEQRLDDLLNERLNESTAELESMFRDNMEELDLSDLETRHEELQDLVESNNDLEERVEELRDAEDIDDASNISEEQLKADLDAMEQALAEVEGQLEAEPPTSEVDNGEIFAQFPFAEELDPEAITVVANYEDGSSEVVSDEFWSVESAGPLGGDQVVVDGLEIADNRAVADLDVKGVSTEGNLGTSRHSIINPAYQGSIPKLDAIDISAHRPGVGETVGMSIRSSDDSFAGSDRAEVYGPDGQQLNVTQEGDRFRWTPEQTGKHTVRMTYTNDINGKFTEVFRLKVGENAQSDPPTLRVTHGIGGKVVIAGDGLDSGSISIEDDTAELVAQTPGGESPNMLDIRAEQLTVDRMDVSVVSGANQQSVDRHVSLRVRANFDIEDALVLRQSGQPITADEETRFGGFEMRTSEQGAEHQVVETYTDADGTATVQVNRNPSLLDRVNYQIALWGIDLPFTTFLLPATPSNTIFTMSMYTPAVDEATPGEIVFGPTDMTTVSTEVTA